MAPQAKPPGLIQRYRELLQTRHYARRTVKTYEQWLRRYLRFHRLRLPESRQVVEIPWGLSPGLAGAELATAQGSGA